MQTLLSLLSDQFSSALQALFAHSVGKELLFPEITQSTQPQFGHYQCNNALKIGKALRANPKEIATQITDAVKSQRLNSPAMIAKLEIAGPGFINITLDTTFLSQEIQKTLTDPRLGVPLPQVREKVVVDFSSPNVAKELHVGHLRSTIIGDAIARLCEFLGHDVLRLNHIGDFGTQFGMLIAYMQALPPETIAQDVSLPQLMHWYKESKKQFDADPDFKKQAHLQVIALQSGEPKSRQAWEKICTISRTAFQEIYDLLDIKLTERGESFYQPYLADLIDDLSHKGLITVSEGAKCLFLEGFISREGLPLPMIVQKSDGGYNYDTTDLASLRYRVAVDHAQRIIWVTDAGQSTHFEMLFKAAEKAGYVNPHEVRLDHVPFGVVLGPDGKKFKTRSGETEKLIDLILEAIAQAQAIMRERLPSLPDDEIALMGKTLGIDAIKYADLSCHRVKDYIFSYDRMLKFEGNTAAFLLYAYVRIQGIKRKVGRPIDTTSPVTIEHPAEIALAIQLRQFPETLDAMSRDLLPNRLTDYLYGLAEKFHAFFRDCRVEGSECENSRLLLCEVTARILKQGLEILGIKTLEKM